MQDEEIWYENMMKRPMDEHPMVIEVQQKKAGFLWQLWFHQY